MGSILDPGTTQADALYPEGEQHRLAMDRAWNINGPKLRDHSGLDESQTATLGKEHGELLAGIVNPVDIHEVHTAMTTALTHRPVSPDEITQSLKKSEAARVEVLNKGRSEFGWRWDAVFARAKANVEAKPGLVKLLQDSGLDNDYKFWGPCLRKALFELQKKEKGG